MPPLKTTAHCHHFSTLNNLSKRPFYKAWQILLAYLKAVNEQFEDRWEWF